MRRTEQPLRMYGGRAWRVVLQIVAVGCAVCAAAGPDVGTEETFDADVSGWSDRDSGEMTIQFDGAGNPGGALSGVSSNLPAPLPETDALRAEAASSLGAFTGSYAAVYGSIAGWQFDFNARSVLPSSAFLRFGGGSNVFFQSFTDLIIQTGAWKRVFLRLDTEADWLGGDRTAFTNVLHGIEFVEIQVTRRGAEPQSYALDNMALVELIPDTGGGARRDGENISIFWGGLKTGYEYDVESTTNLFESWTPSAMFTATNNLTEWIAPFPADKGRNYYRIRITEIPLQ